MFGLVLAIGGCVAGRTRGSTSQSAPRTVPVDAAVAGDVLACAEEQFRAAGYAAHRDVRTPLVIQAERETPTTGDAYEVNVAGAHLGSADRNSKVLQFWVSAETRTFRSRAYNAGYELREPARPDVVQLAQGVMVACAKE